jgi:hypothetical protein
MKGWWGWNKQKTEGYGSGEKLFGDIMIGACHCEFAKFIECRTRVNPTFAMDSE